jgi:hypothetical protein
LENASLKMSCCEQPDLPAQDERLYRAWAKIDLVGHHK